MNQPIWMLYTGSDPTNGICAEILRCEGFPWLEEHSTEGFDGVPPGVKLLVAAGFGIHPRTAERLAKAVAQGVRLVSVAPDSTLAEAFGVSVHERVLDAHLSVVDLPHWEHGDVSLLCPDDVARPLEGGQMLADLHDPNGQRCGSSIVTVRLGKGRAWFYGYDLCRTIATLRHGTGRLDASSEDHTGWTGPRAVYSFWELSGKLPHDVPVADVHQDILRSIVAEALAGTSLPRLWYLPHAAPALWFVRGDGCGEAGADFEVEVLEQHGPISPSAVRSRAGTAANSCASGTPEDMAFPSRRTSTTSPSRSWGAALGGRSVRVEPRLS